jgi:hypothetical protein
MYRLHWSHPGLPQPRRRRHRLAVSQSLPIPSFFSRSLSSIWQSALSSRRRYALGGLLIAFSLEVCGCNPVLDCARVRHTQIASLPWFQLLQQCSQCLTIREVARLERGWQTEQQRWAGIGLPASFASNRTVEQALQGDMDIPVDTDSALDGSPSQPRLRTRSTTSVSPPDQPWAIPESVFFVYTDLRRIDTLAPRTPAATAFVVSVPGPQRGLVRFLVTARHVVDPQWAHCAEPDPDAIDVRFNRRSGGVAYETIPLHSSGIKRFLTPSDPAADLAIIPLDQALGPRVEEYKIFDTPFRLLATGHESQLLHPGLPVVTARLPQFPSDEIDNYPVFDAGTLATMPTSSIEVHCGRPDDPLSDTQPPTKPLHVWLIDGGIPRGVSGSPVYTRLARAEGAAEATVLLGVQSVTWPDKGIAGITPSTVLADLIRSALRENKPGSAPHRRLTPNRQESLASLY